MVAQIEPPILPLRLYRYRSLKDDKALVRELKALKDSYIWCSKFTDLNDPMEGAFRPSSRIDKVNLREVNRLIEGKLSEIGIACFSESYENEVMWAHYAGSFCGICIAYDSRRLQRRLDNSTFLVRIAYDEKLPRLGSSEANNILGSVVEKLDAPASDALARQLLSYKKRTWDYEREWRVLDKIGHNNIRGSSKPLRYPLITDIYLGSKIKEENRKEILAQSKSLGFTVHQMQKRTHEWQVVR
jgi:hypothetical protein